MSRISRTGKGLSVLISCEYTFHHNWMSFASWFSIYKNLPDAQVGVFCKRSDLSASLFYWPLRYKIPFIKYSNEFTIPVGSMVITPDVLAVGVYNEDAIGPVDVKNEENFTFVSYLEGCGEFVLNQWIDISRNPFNITGRLYSNNLSVNEYRVFKLWEKCHRFYC